MLNQTKLFSFEKSNPIQTKTRVIWNTQQNLT